MEASFTYDLQLKPKTYGSSRGRQFGGCFSSRTKRTLLPMKTEKQSKPATQAEHSQDGLGPQTKAIHGGEAERHGVNGPVVTEIIRTSTFTFSNTEQMKEWAEGKNKAYIYTRYGNPTLSIAEAKIAALEGAEAAVVPLFFRRGVSLVDVVRKPKT